MRKVTIKTVLLLAALTALGAVGVASAGGRGNPTPAAPLIIKTVVDEKENILVISGHNFGVVAPTVSLADQLLRVSQFSESEIVVHLPADLTSGTYGVSVTTGGGNQIRSNLFSAMLPGIEARVISVRNTK